MIRLPRQFKPVGRGAHRHGWPWVLKNLRSIEGASGMFVDDFTERSFGTSFRGWEEPWVGIWHHPPNMPEWFNKAQHLDTITARQSFHRAVRHMKGCVTTSEYLARDLRRRFDVPVITLKHPTPFDVPKFSFTEWEKNKQMVQIGWYLRNYKAIYQVAAPKVKKIYLKQDMPWVVDARKMIDENDPNRDRPFRGMTHICAKLNDQEYDQMFVRSIVFLELLDSSANNVVIEAIARNAPVIVNRHSAVEEYLGKDYPLFYDDIEEVGVLTDPSMIRSAWEYLQNLDKHELGIDYFKNNLNEFVEGVR